MEWCISGWENGGASAKVIDSVYHDGYGICYRMAPEDAAEELDSAKEENRASISEKRPMR